LKTCVLKPNLYLIGAPKAGTTVVAETFRSHPEFFVPPIKEPRFFDAPVYYDHLEDYPIVSLANYLELYENASAKQHRWLVDASVFNMYRIQSIHEILNLSPEAKFLVFLRDPLTATKSMHSQRLKYAEPSMREISEDFGICWRSLQQRKYGKGFPEKCRNRFLFRYDQLFSYEKYIPQILELVKPESIRIFLYEDLQRQPLQVCRRLTNYLGLRTPLKWNDTIFNAASVVSNNWFSRLVLRAAGRTSAFRRRMGFSGKSVVRLRKLLTGQRKYTIQNDPDLDQEIRDFFENTYGWLKEINKKTSENE